MKTIARSPVALLLLLLSLWARTTSGEKGRGIIVEAAVQPPGSLKPMLNVVAVGISAYEDEPLRLRFAAKDAEDLGAALRKQEGRTYASVRVHPMTDERATRDNILAELSWLERESRPGDVSLFYLAGHATADGSDGNRLRLLAVDYQSARAATSSILGTELQEHLGAIQGTLIVILDTCFAGTLVWQAGALNQLQQDAQSSPRGVVLIAAAARGELAREMVALRSGVLTRAVIEALSGNADYQDRGEVMLSAVSHYVSERVRDLTFGMQRPVIWNPVAVRDFIVAHGRRPLRRRPWFWGGIAASLLTGFAAAGVSLAFTRPWNSPPIVILK